MLATIHYRLLPPFGFAVSFVLLLASFVSADPALDPEPASAPEPVMFESFDRPEPGPVSDMLLAKPQIELAPGQGVAGSNAIRVQYVGYERGSERIVQRIPLNASLPEATLSYDVKFERDFQFVGGGKLHGLGPDRPIAGGQVMHPDGWSARITFAQGGGVKTYIYCQNKKTKWGDSHSAEDFVFEKDRYYAVSLHVKLNDPGETNGSATIYVDGKPVVTHEGIAYRGVGGDPTLITEFLFSTFHGGSSPKWAPRDDEGNFITVHACFDNFAVYPGRHVRPAPGADLPKEPDPMHVINAGIPGNNTRNLLARFEKDVAAHQPDLVVLLVGGNDCLNSTKPVPVDEYVTNVKQLLERIEALPARTLLLTLTPCRDASLLTRHPADFYAPGSPTDRIDQYNAAIRDIAAQTGTPLADAHAAFQAHPEPMSLLRTLANSGDDDGIHPTAAGHDLLAHLVADAIRLHGLPHERIVCFGDSITAGVFMEGAGTAEGGTYPARLVRLLKD